MTDFRTHMAQRGSPPAFVPSVVSQNVKPVLLSNIVDCSRLTAHSVTEECPQGKTAVQTTRRVNNGTVCIHGTAEVSLAQNVLIQRGHLAPFSNGHPSNDGVWGPSSQEAFNRWLQLNNLKQDRKCLTNAFFDMLKVLYRPTLPPRPVVRPRPTPPTRSEEDEGETVVDDNDSFVAPPRSFGACSDFTGRTGTCYDVNTTPCSGRFRIGLCPGARNIQCCFLN